MEWFLLYYGIGVFLGVYGLATAERRPAERFPFLSKIVVWSYNVSLCGIFWGFGIVAVVFEAIQSRSFANTSNSQCFPKDEDGQVWLTRSSMGDLVMMAVFMFALPGILLIQMGHRDDRFVDFQFAFFLALILSVPEILIFRQSWFQRFGLRCIDNELVWMECPFWTPKPYRLPLSAVAFAQSVETDPVNFERGIALILKDGTRLKFGREVKLADWIDLDPQIPLCRIVLWEHDKWDWEPHQVLSWLKSQGVQINDELEAAKAG